MSIAFLYKVKYFPVNQGPYAAFPNRRGSMSETALNQQCTRFLCRNQAPETEKKSVMSMLGQASRYPEEKSSSRLIEICLPDGHC